MERIAKPRKPRTHLRRKLVGAHVRRTEHAALASLAEKQGLTVSTILRNLIVAELSRVST